MIQNIVCFDKVEQEQVDIWAKLNVKLINFDDVIKAGQN